MEEIVNRVANSPLVSLDLEDYIHQGERVTFDLTQVLYEGIILKEKDFRGFLKTHDWSVFDGKNVGLICSAEAIVPTWAYMLLATQLLDFANLVTFGDQAEIEKALVNQAVEKCLSEQDWNGKKVVIKGCGSIQNIEYAYLLLTEKLYPQVSSIMYGEPCSTVPIFKRKK